MALPGRHYLVGVPETVSRLCNLQPRRGAYQTLKLVAPRSSRNNRHDTFTKERKSRHPIPIVAPKYGR